MLLEQNTIKVDNAENQHIQQQQQKVNIQYNQIADNYFPLIFYFLIHKKINFYKYNIFF